MNKTYKLLYEDPEINNVFWQKIKEDFRYYGIRYNTLLKNVTLWLGIVPEGRRWTNEPRVAGWYSAARKNVVVRNITVKPDPELPASIGEYQVDRSRHVLYHEIGHHIHLTYLSRSTPDHVWRKWRDITGYTLDFQRGNDFAGQIPAWENFADDFSDFMRGKFSGKNFIRRRKFYLNLWQEVGMYLELFVNKPEAKIDGETVFIDPDNKNITPDIVDGRTRLPLRFIHEIITRKAGQKVIAKPNVDWFPKDGKTEKIVVEI